MKVRITEKDVSVPGQNPGEEKVLSVGDEIDVPGDTMPASLINKAVRVDGVQTFVVNPEINPATGKPFTKKEREANAAAAAKERAEVAESAALLGVTVTDDMTVEQIKAAMAALGQ